MSRPAGMRRLLLASLCVLFAASAIAQVRVKGYTKRDGTYVAPHYRSAPNNTKIDNYSTRGNINPYTGKTGTVDPYQYPSNSYEYTSPTPYVAPAPAANSWQTSDPDLDDGTRNPKSLSLYEAEDWSNDDDDDEGGDDD